MRSVWTGDPLVVGVSILLGACSSSSSPGAAAPGDANAIDASDDAAQSMDASGTDALDASPGSEAEAGDGSTKAAWGDPCTVGHDTTCASGLFCLQGPAGGTVGFCTQTCPSASSGVCTGTPPGTTAYCVVTTVDAQGDKGCAFLCRAGAQTYTCPGELKCQTTDDPAGSGDYLCLP